MASGPPLGGGLAAETRTEGATISVGQEAKEFLGDMECPEGEVLHLEEYWSETGKRRVRFEIGDPEAHDEVLCREGKISLHVFGAVPRKGLPVGHQLWSRYASRTLRRGLFARRPFLPA